MHWIRKILGLQSYNSTNQRNLPVDVLVTDELVACGEGDDFT